MQNGHAAGPEQFVDARDAASPRGARHDAPAARRAERVAWRDADGRSAGREQPINDVPV
jgi:hypothetical protein